MAQVIRNIRVGQLFEIVENNSCGFKVGCIVQAVTEALNIKDNDTGHVADFCWVGGYKPLYVRHEDEIILSHRLTDLKRFKGKIK